MTKQFNEYADRYYETFNDLYPMGMIEESEKEAVGRMKECLSKGKSAPTLWPDLFGSLDGKDV